jgi:hypothetical protein
MHTRHNQKNTRELFVYIKNDAFREHSLLQRREVELFKRFIVVGERFFVAAN